LDILYKVDAFGRAAVEIRGAERHVRRGARRRCLKAAHQSISEEMRFSVDEVDHDALDRGLNAASLFGLRRCVFCTQPVASPKGPCQSRARPITGAAGEYFVMGELLRQGWVAGLTPRGAANFDIVATEGARTIRVRVKTKTADSDLFRWNADKKDGAIFKRAGESDDYCVLGDLAGSRPSTTSCRHRSSSGS